MRFLTQALPQAPTAVALDGAEVRVLPVLKGGSLAHCTLGPGIVSQAVTHRTVEEIWYFLEGEGEVWREQHGVQAVSAVRPGTSLTLPLGTHFQFRNTGQTPLRFLIITMPPWPGPNEAYVVENHWVPT